MRSSYNYIRSVYQYLVRHNEAEIQSLNGIRALAIALIFITHIWGYVIPFAPPEVLNSEISAFFLNSATGVDLFFLLSGFLISLGLKKQYQRSGSIDFLFFYKKRILRIFPAYYFFIFFSLIPLFIFKTPFRPDYYFIEIFYISNYFQGQMPHTWSLAVEEQFYLVFPLFASWFLFRLSPGKRLAVLLLLYAIPAIARILILSGNETTLSAYAFQIYKPAHTRMDAIVVGIIIMEIYTEKFFLIQKFGSGIRLVLLLALAMPLLYFGHIFSHAPGPVIQSIYRYNFINTGFGIIFFLALARNPLSRILAAGIFRPVARLSYTMYLWHYILGGIATGLVPGARLHPFSWGMVLYAYVALFFYIALFSSVLFGLVEYPFLRKKERLK